MTRPASYLEWKYCITELCRIRLSEVYITERLQRLKDNNDLHTKEYIRLYGVDYRNQVISWFEIALQEYTTKK